MSYCTRADIRARLSELGEVHVADDDGDQEVGTSEVTSAVTSAIDYATAEIDAALTPWFNSPFSITPANDWLKFRAVDIACERLAGRRGDEIPPSLALAADRSRADLEKVRTGDFRVPGLNYPADGFRTERQQMGVPRAWNPGRRGRYCG